VNRSIAAALVALLLLFVAAPPSARADELCPGCYGKGKVGCGRCTTTGIGAFVGKCSTCTGFFATQTGGRCTVCQGTGTCTGCDGKGMQCLGCKGSGRVPNGTAQAMADRRAKEQKEGLARQIGALKGLVGRWKGQGTSADRGKYTTEMRWSMALDDSFVRHEERIKYESGAVVECVSYLTWVQSQGQYLWTLAFAPGRCIQINGTPKDGKLVWEFPTNSGYARSTWSLDAEAKVLEIEDATMDGGEWKDTGSARIKRTAAEPGDSVLQGAASEEPDEATAAVLAGMKPLRYMLGWWKGEGEGPQGKITTEGLWRSRLGGTVFELDSSSKRGDNKTKERGFLTWDPEHKKFLIAAFIPGGQVMVVNGTINEAANEVTIDVFGPRLVWKLDPGKQRLVWSVDARQDDGETWKTIEKGIDTLTEKGE
jgi:hypothetical protein